MIKISSENTAKISKRKLRAIFANNISWFSWFLPSTPQRSNPPLFSSTTVSVSVSIQRTFLLERVALSLKSLNSTQLNSTQSSKAKQVGECGKEMHVNKNRVMMTEEQMEVLRQQIAAYAIISDQLVQMHKAFSAQHTHSGLSLSVFFLNMGVICFGHWVTVVWVWGYIKICSSYFDRCIHDSYIMLN